MKKLFVLAIGALVLMGAGCMTKTSVSVPDIGVNVAGPGEHCGGNIQGALGCTAGYHCAPSADSHLPFGDVGGTCVAD